MPPPRDERLGRVLADRYRLDRRLSGGGMGAVYAARHLRIDSDVAVKVLHSSVAVGSELYKRFQQEARIGFTLQHPNIVQVKDFDQDSDGTPFMVMELLDGEDLHQAVSAALMRICGGAAGHGGGCSSGGSWWRASARQSARMASSAMPMGVDRGAPVSMDTRTAA